jgi:hypothetical protein
MKLTRTAFAAVAAVIAIAGLAIVGTQPASAAVKSKQTAGVTKAKANKPLSGTIYGNRRRGGYSVKKADVISGGPASDPAAQGYYPSGGLDDDFSYTRPSGPFGGYTPYMH